jgi:spermidine synthase
VSVLAGGVLSAIWAFAADSSLSLGSLEFDTKSEYSHIRVYRRHNVRTMVFVRDSGQEAFQSQVNLDRPYDLHFAYLHDMFVSYLFRSNQEKVLIVGLGGGSMIHFLRHYDPLLQIDAVEIDPVVVSVAKTYFGVRTDDKVKILTGDGIRYLETADAQYDVIYMDAFLKPSAGTDSTGAPLRLRTLSFYAEVQKRLTPGGVVVFNLNPHPRIEEDLQVIRKAFRHTYVFRLPGGQGLVVVGSTAAEREEVSTLLARARELDHRFGGSLSFTSTVRHLDR